MRLTTLIIFKALAAELLGEQVIANVSVSGEKVAAGIEGMQVQTLQVCSQFGVCLIWECEG